MNLANCISPVTLHNPYTGELCSVPCGHCEACLNSRSSIWVQRLMQESMCWPYTVFLTLTYDDDHLPKYKPVGNNPMEYVNIETSEYLSLNDSQYDPVFLKKRGCIPCGSVRDCQLFFKKLRYFCNEKIKQNKSSDSSRLRYYLAFEYGETTFRPHYHALLFFSSCLLASNLQELLHKSWTLGNFQWSFARNASAYVAKYLNCTTNLPKVYAHPSLRPFSLCSKSPSLGSLSIPSKEVFEIWNHGTAERTIFDRQAGKYVNVPLWRSTQDRLFPKISGFDTLSHFDRVTLYAVSRFYDFDSFEDFKVQVEKECDDAYRLLANTNYHKWLIDVVTRNYRSKDDSILKRWWYISRRVVNQCDIFGSTVDYYVSRIELYYSHKELYRLRKMYEFQSEYADQFGCQTLINIDPIFVRKTDLTKMVSLNLTDSEKMTLEGYGIDPDKFAYDELYRRDLDLYRTPNWLSFVDSNKRIFNNNVKTKRKNDYLALHPEYRYF